jgi:hypothetical protein
VYFDLDVLFLKDLRPLCSVEFFYQWSNQPYGNNAVMHFRQGSADAQRLIERSLRLRSARPRALLPFDALATVVDRTHVFPCFAFDPIWIAHDTRTPNNEHFNRFGEFFEREHAIPLADLFPGSYAHHWHGRWTVPIQPRTIIGCLADEVDARLRKRHGQDLAQQREPQKTLASG